MENQGKTKEGTSTGPETGRTKHKQQAGKLEYPLMGTFENNRQPLEASILRLTVNVKAKNHD